MMNIINGLTNLRPLIFASDSPDSSHGLTNMSDPPALLLVFDIVTLYIIVHTTHGIFICTGVER